MANVAIVSEWRLMHAINITLTLWQLQGLGGERELTNCEDMTTIMSLEWQQGNWASHKLTIPLNSQRYRDLGDLSNLKTGNKTVIFISLLKLERYTRWEGPRRDMISKDIKYLDSHD